MQVIAATTLALAAVGLVDASSITITNKCSTSQTIYTRLGGTYGDKSDEVAVGASITKSIDAGFEGNIRAGSDDAATLAEFSVDKSGKIWWDLSIIPPRLNPGFVFCDTLDLCKKNSQSGIGFNKAIKIIPQGEDTTGNCHEIDCPEDGCPDAYNFPKDDTKTHNCDAGTSFEVIFYEPNGSSGDDNAPTPSGSSGSGRSAADMSKSADASADSASQGAMSSQQDGLEVVAQELAQNIPKNPTDAPESPEAPTDASKTNDDSHDENAGHSNAAAPVLSDNGSKPAADSPHVTSAPSAGADHTTDCDPQF